MTVESLKKKNLADIDKNESILAVWDWDLVKVLAAARKYNSDGCHSHLYLNILWTL